MSPAMSLTRKIYFENIVARKLCDEWWCNVQVDHLSRRQSPLPANALMAPYVISARPPTAAKIFAAKIRQELQRYHRNQK
jgi:hypothetical protein